jgi:hypothetical protein
LYENNSYSREGVALRMNQSAALIFFHCIFSAKTQKFEFIEVEIANSFYIFYIATSEFTKNALFSSHLSKKLWPY